MPGVARQNLLKPYLVTDGRKFRLKDVKPSDTAGLNAAFKDRAPEPPPGPPVSGPRAEMGS